MTVGTMRDRTVGARAASLTLFFLLLVVPFEPRFTIPLGPIHVSLVEAMALLAFVVLAVATRTQGMRGLSAPPILSLLALFVISVLSASVADVGPGRAVRFALRLGAMALFAILVSRLDETPLRFGLCGLTVAGASGAVLALAEGVGVRSLDVLLGVFREMPFNVAGVRRATAGSEYPNLGAAMLVYAMLAGVALFRDKPRLRGLLVILMSGGIVFTYSRGAWLAGLVGLLASSLADRPRHRFNPPILFALVVGLFLTRAEISQLRLGGENANDFYSAVYETPRLVAMDAGARIPFAVKVRNVGRKPWRQSDQIHLSYHLYESDALPLVDGERADLPRDVLPGESVVIETILPAPAKVGEYLLMWDLVQEDTTWFSGQGVKPGVVRLIVGRDVTSPPAITEASAIKTIPDTLAWRPSRFDLWRIAFRMWTAHPLLGIGPDNFRWTYGLFVGKAVFDTRVFANNTFLEMAATLGALGLAALCAAIVLAFRTGWRMKDPSDVALAAFAILIAITVHGLTDYLLAFTGHYLVFGFAIGVLSRDGRMAS